MTTMTAAPTTEEILARATELVPVLAERALECETLRRLPDATVEDFRNAGLFRIVQPARWGGYELPLCTMLDAVAIVGRACGSSAWCLTVLAVHNWFIGLFPDEAQADVFGDDPDAILAAVFYSGGTVTPVDGGFRLTGRWSFASGCDHGDWIALGANVQSDADETVPDVRSVLVPRADFTIVDDWHVSGLRGTGSKTVVVDDVFVPEHRLLSLPAAIMGCAPGAEVNTAPLYRMPFASTLALALAAPSVGIARGALDLFREQAKGRVRAYTAANNATAAQNSLVQLRLAESTCEVDAAELIMRRDADELAYRIEAGEEISLELRARARVSTAYALELSRRAVSRILATAGGRAIYDTNPLQRAMRDLDTMGAHVALSFDSAAEQFGAVDLGLPPTTLLI